MSTAIIVLAAVALVDDGKISSSEFDAILVILLLVFIALE
jgi:hypothetical protein